MPPLTKTPVSEPATREAAPPVVSPFFVFDDAESVRDLPAYCVEDIPVMIDQALRRALHHELSQPADGHCGAFAGDHSFHDPMIRKAGA
jgi:hypothetical protein